MENKDDTSSAVSPAAAALAERKARSRAYIRSLPPEEKVRLLIRLNEQYYSMLELRELSGGKPIPERWRKWREAREPFAEARKE